VPGLASAVVVGAVVVGAVAEEIHYRAIGFEILTQITGSDLLAGGLVVLVFALTRDIWALMLVHKATDRAGLILPRLRKGA